jgi:hypothetical protein
MKRFCPDRITTGGRSRRAKPEREQPEHSGACGGAAQREEKRVDEIDAKRRHAGVSEKSDVSATHARPESGIENGAVAASLPAMFAILDSRLTTLRASLGVLLSL